MEINSLSECQTESVTGSLASPTTRPSLRAYAILLSAQVAIGAAAIFARFALHGAQPIAVAALRLIIAAVPLLLLNRLDKKNIVVPRHHEVLFAASGVALAIHFASWIGSLLYTSVAISTLLVSTGPVWTTLYDALILKQRLHKYSWLALFAGAFGVAFIVTSHTSRAPISGLEPFGDFLALIGGLAIAGYLIAIRLVSHLYPTVLVVSRTYSWSALALSATALAAGQMPPGNDIISWAGILAMALISQVLGHTGMNASLRWFTSSTVAFSTLLEPVFATALGALIFAENLSTQALAGSLLVLLCVAVILHLPQSDSKLQVEKGDGKP